MTAQPTRDQLEAELDYWMTRAYEAEGKLWKAEARVRHLEDTSRVLVQEVLAAQDARDKHRRGKAAAEAQIAEEKHLRMKATAAVTKAEARIKAVEDVLDAEEARPRPIGGGYDKRAMVRIADIRRALESVPPPSA